MKFQSSASLPSRHRIALWSILGFWLFYYVVVTIRAMVIGFENQPDLAVRRIAVAFAGMVICYGIYCLLRRMSDQRFWRRVTFAILLSIPASILFGAVNHAAFYLVDPVEEAGKKYGSEKKEEEGTIALLADGSSYWLFFFCAWSALYLAISYSIDAREQQRRLSEIQAQAHQAQLRALRYQINPHFLFNTLNSISSLILANRNAQAEQMVLNLSTFFRSGLATDPMEDVRLVDEIALQQLYLDIEKIRFPDRLKIVIDVPSELADLLVPSLILQPAVENAIKYGVSRTKGPVTLTIRAMRKDDALIIRVEDDGRAPDPGNGLGGGTGLGLRNMCERITARYGPAGRCTHGPREGGGFFVELAIPMSANG